MKHQDQFEQVDGLALMGEERDDAGRWIERTEGALWGGAGLVCAVVIVGLVIAAVLG